MLPEKIEAWSQHSIFCDIVSEESAGNPMTESITIQVASDLARAYRGADEQARRKLDVLLNLRLQEALASPGSLQDLMRDIGRKARERGLTPEILESILNDD